MLLSIIVKFIFFVKHFLQKKGGRTLPATEFDTCVSQTTGMRVNVFSDEGIMPGGTEWTVIGWFYEPTPISFVLLMSVWGKQK